MNKAFLGLGEVEGPQAFLESVAGSVPWEERVSLESRDRREASGAGALEGRRATMAETGLAVKDAKAKKEKEDSLDTQVQRESLASQGQEDHRDPKASEAEGEIQDLRVQLGRRETLATQDHLVPKATEVTPWINVPLSRASKINVLAAMGPWNAPSSRRSWPLL